MKRTPILVLAWLLLLTGFFVASCQEEKHEHLHAPYGYYRVYLGGYPHQGYYLMDESVQNDGLLQLDSTVQP